MDDNNVLDLSALILNHKLEHNICGKQVGNIVIKSVVLQITSDKQSLINRLSSITERYPVVSRKNVFQMIENSEKGTNIIIGLLTD
jgi:hypothetical protein